MKWIKKKIIKIKSLKKKNNERFIKKFLHSIFSIKSRVKTIHQRFLSINVDELPETSTNRNVYQAFVNWVIGILEIGFIITFAIIIIKLFITQPFKWYLIPGYIIGFGLGFEFYERIVRVYKQ